MYAPVYQPQPYEVIQQVPVAEPPPTQRSQSSACPLCMKTFVYILNIMVVSIGCCSVYGSPVFKLYIQSTPKYSTHKQTVQYNDTHTIEVTLNRTCDFCELPSEEKSLVFWQAAGFGVFGFANILMIGTSVLLHCSALNDYWTSTVKTLDPCLFVMGGIIMAFTCTALFYPVSYSCSFFSNTGPSFYKSDDAEMKRILQALCNARWRADIAITALVLGVFTILMYFIVTCIFVLECASSRSQAYTPQVQYYEPEDPIPVIPVESNTNYGPPAYGQQSLPQPLPSPQPQRSATYNIMARTEA